LHGGFVASGTCALKNISAMCTIRPATPLRKLGEEDISQLGRERWSDREPAEGSAHVGCRVAQARPTLYVFLNTPVVTFHADISLGYPTENFLAKILVWHERELVDKYRATVVARPHNPSGYSFTPTLSTSSANVSRTPLYRRTPVKSRRCAATASAAGSYRHG
jgi:hypothetical protein